MRPTALAEGRAADIPAAAPPGNAVLITRGASPRGSGSRSSSVARRPAAAPRAGQAGVRRRDSRTSARASSSKVNTATSMSAITLRSSMVASSTSRR